MVKHTYVLSHESDYYSRTTLCLPRRSEGKVMFSASVDGTITLWAPNGMPYSTLEVGWMCLISVHVSCVSV